ncbi:MAG: SET domain-containing protein [Bdellovibrionales bacterium]|nr:SET domain-containing protein [Bdellovibrionales bacterium]
MLLVKSFLKFSEIHGVGCFAAEDITAGQVVWKFDPVLDVELDADKIDSYPPAVVSFLQMYAYGQQTETKKTFILCGDHARHMNHSDNPNLIEAGDGNAFNIAGRDIKSGEELTCDYNSFDTDASFKLHHKQ